MTRFFGSLQILFYCSFGAIIQSWAAPVNLDKDLLVLEDSDYQFDFQDVIHQLNYFKPVYKHPVPGEGVFAGRLWLHLPKGNLPVQDDRVIRTSNFFFESIRVYNDSGEIIAKGGARIPLNQWSIPSNYFTLPIPDHYQGDLWIEIISDDASYLSFFLMSENEANEKFTIQLIFQAIASGFFLMIAFYALIMFVKLRRIYFLLLSTGSVFTWILGLKFTGFGFLYLWPSSPEWNLVAGFVLILITVANMILFAYFLFDVPSVLPKFKVPLLLLLASYFVLLIIGFPLVERATIVGIMHILPGTSFLLITAFGLYAWFKRIPLAGYFSLGWLSLTVFSLPFGLRNAGILEDNFFTQNSTTFGHFIEFIAFAFAASTYAKLNQKNVQKLQLELSESEDQIKKLIPFLHAREYNGATAELLQNFPSDLSFINDQIEEPLSQRELEVLHCMIDGLNNTLIAEKLFVSVNTIKKHVASIYRKLQVNSRVDATKIVMDSMSKR